MFGLIWGIIHGVGCRVRVGGRVWGAGLGPRVSHVSWIVRLPLSEALGL